MRWIIVGWVLVLSGLRADIVECENGDRYNGKVLLVDEQVVKVKNEITGVLSIPRSKVSAITFVTAKTRGAIPPKTNSLSSSEAIEKVQNQFLSEATPEATQMYQDMVRDLLSGKMNLNDLKLKAQGTLKELDDLKSELGDDDAAALLGSYAAILENFLKSQEIANTNSPAKLAPAQSR